MKNLPARTKEATITVGSQVPAKDKNQKHLSTDPLSTPSNQSHTQIRDFLPTPEEAQKVARNSMTQSAHTHRWQSKQALGVRETDTQPQLPPAVKLKSRPLPHSIPKTNFRSSHTPDPQRASSRKLCNLLRSLGPRLGWDLTTVAWLQSLNLAESHMTSRAGTGCP